MRSLLALLGIALLGIGCGDKVCAGLELATVSPGDTTIAVGASFTIHAEQGGSCDGIHITDPRPLALRWVTRDTAIVQVDSSTGRVTGRSPGDAQVTEPGGGFVVKVHVRLSGIATMRPTER